MWEREPMASVAPGIPSVRVADTSELPDALRRLGLDAPRPVVALVGGASGLVDGGHLRDLFTDELVPVVRRVGAAIVDGATDAGVVALVGRARAEDEAAGFPLVGVAVEALVRAEAEIEPHHTHLLLVPGSDWGDETPWLARVAGALAGPRPSVTVLVEGGEIALADVEESVAAGRRVVVVEGSGRTADALAGAADGPRLDALRASGLVEAVPPGSLATVLAPILEAP
jgi:SLOG in TRPM, prokaryote